MRYLYDKLVLHCGYLILPFHCGTISGVDLYNYQLLSAFDRQGAFHKAVNPTEDYAGSVRGIVAIAQAFLDQYSDLKAVPAYDQQRYVYQGHLIVISQINRKYFYDHYPPDRLDNLAAPRLFDTEADCIAWVKGGLDRLHSPSVSQ